MSNDIAKALKQKTDAMLRLQGQSQKPVVYENIDGTHYAPEQADYSAALAQGENIEILVSENTKTIKAVIPQATEIKLGGIKAKAKTTETSEVVIDPATGKLYSQAPSGASVNNERTGTPLLFWVGTEAEYQAITTPDANTLYFRS